MITLALKAAAVLVTAAAGPSAFGIQASPYHINATAGSSATVTITDVGTKRVTVGTGVLAVHKVSGLCGVTANGVPPGVTISPAQLTLRPGHHKTATVHIASSVPASDLALVFTSKPDGNGTARVVGAVGIQLVIAAKPGQHAVSRCISVHHIAAKPAADVTSTGPPAAETGGAAGAAVILCGLGAWAWWRSRRQRGRSMES